LITAMAKRRQPLLVSISTTTDNTTGIGKQIWDYSLKVLEGLDDERFFALIFAADDSDDVWSERTWRKANPGWPRLVQPEALRAVAKQAQASPALKSAFMTRHLNLWTGAESALFDLAYWDKCANPNLNLEEFEGQPCFIAIDMAMRVDLAAASLIFPYMEERDTDVRYALFHKAWIPEASLDPHRQPLYIEWVENGFLEVTPGEVTDYNTIEEWVKSIARRFDLRNCGYDPYALMQLAQRLANDGLPMLEFRATVLNFSEPTKMLDALTRQGPTRLEQDASPVARWCMGNVVGHYDRRGNVYPHKAPLQIASKIDCAITNIMCLGVALAAEAESDTIYRGDRELLVW
jgi:phage terminase large subunit-like protein